VTNIGKFCGHFVYFTVIWYIVPMAIWSQHVKIQFPEYIYICIYATVQLKHRRAGQGSCKQGCQMALFQTKNTNLVKFWRGLAVEDVGIF
jgi:hypothetical protein